MLSVMCLGRKKSTCSNCLHASDQIMRKIKRGGEVGRTVKHTPRDRTWILTLRQGLKTIQSREQSIF